MLYRQDNIFQQFYNESTENDRRSKCDTQFLEILASVAVATGCRDTRLTSACLMPIKPQDSVIITRLILYNKCEINIGIIGIMFMKWKLQR